MKNFAFVSILVAFLATSALADSNGTPDNLVNSGTPVNLMGGPFDHGASFGDGSNSTASVIFNESFAANQILIEGDLTGVISSGGNYFFDEADIVVTDPAGGTVT